MSVSPFLVWRDFHARSRFARSTIPEGKWGTTRSLHYIEKHRHRGQGKIGRGKREDPGNEAVRKWKTRPKPSRACNFTTQPRKQI